MSNLILYFQTFLKKLESAAFKVPDNINTPQRWGDLNSLNTLFFYPTYFYLYLRSTMIYTLIFNIILSCLLIYYVSCYFFLFYTTDIFLTIWLSCLTLVNLLAIVPKLLILKRLTTYDLMEDRINLSRRLWLFIRCKIYNLMTRISHISFFLNLTGLFRIWQLNLKKRENINDFDYELTSENPLIRITYLLLFIFIINLVFSFLKFNAYFHNEILEKEKGLLKGDLKMLKIEDYTKEIMEKFKEKNECAICCEDFRVKEKIRFMSCPGKHFFHLECIDKWLLNKKTCPICNFNLEIVKDKGHFF